MKTMKITSPLALTLLFCATLFISCKEDPKKTEETAIVQETTEAPQMVTHVMTKEDQDNMTPQMVIDDFKAGNERFVNQQTTNRNHGEQIRKTALAQYPKAIVLSCVDSRVPVEDLFDQGIGDVFVGRVAGNFVNEDLLGSMEFATKVAGAKLVIIMGHKYCGAVKGAIDNAELGNLTAMLKKIKPAVNAVEEPQDKAIRNSKNDDFVEAVSNKNVLLNIEKTLAQSPVLAEMQEKGEIKIVGATYDLSTGKVTFFE
ncbi:carbonic anhydrase family protein [Aequorivita sp. CIP111184]|uniref:carbonic anhydrase family protein n=1 Tax=Aequorivita sp. CIP111184 TaxID=2211356 RepID=UPI000DBBCB89|nr:carbonic anhydrase family protein [Aequorivita sp. CIP111184]SRX55274.1 Carbonic anhydrase [Aequorivita sp. CIP111184]